MAVKPKKSSSPISCGIFLVLFVVLIAAMHNAPSVHADHPPSKIDLYAVENFSAPNSFITAFPGYNGTAAMPGFGASNVFDFDMKLSEDLDAPVVGQLVGQVLRLRGTSVYLDVAISLNTPSYSGYVTAQFLGEALRNGEGPITGGSGDFRGVGGYLVFVVVDSSNSEAVKLSTALHLV